MAEDLRITVGSKESQYDSILPQISSLIYGESDQIANMANICAALKEQFNFFWVGFYMIKDDELVLGPFQGPVACTRIKRGKGVCGSAWEQKKTIIVPDVDLFPGHIACSSASKSEIVIPIIRNGNVIGVLDVDSTALNSFDDLFTQDQDDMWIRFNACFLWNGLRDSFRMVISKKGLKDHLAKKINICPVKGGRRPRHSSRKYKNTINQVKSHKTRRSRRK
jgi:GAF domain-containing protein